MSSLPARIGFFEPYAGSFRVGGTSLPLTLIFRPACSYGCLWAFSQFIKKLLDFFFLLCYFLLTRRAFESSHNSFRELRKEFFIAFRERGSKTLSLSNDLVYPQYLVLGFVRDSNGSLIQSTSVSVFATRSDALSFINRESYRLSSFLRSDSFDSYSDLFSPAFRLYHLTRSKI